MLDDVRLIEAQLKQILYGAVEHVQATKAALYLSATHDLNDKAYELVTGYGFNDAGRRLVKGNDDLVDRLIVKRNAFFVNGLGTDMRLSELLFRQGTDRLLASPLFSRGRLVGFIDMRDKAGKKQFDNNDLEAARNIADDILALLGSKKLFGIAPIALATVDPRHESQRSSMQTLVVPPSGPAPNAAPPLAVSQGRAEMTNQAARAIEAAREYMSRRQHTAAAAGKRTLTDRDLEVVHLLLPASLAIPGAVLACFSAIGHVNNPQAIVAIATVTDDAMDMVQSHLQAWLKRTNQATTTTRPQLIYPFGVQVVPVTAAGISTILSAPVNAQSVEGLVLTVAFERTPEAQAQRAMHIFMRQIEQTVESAISAGGTSSRDTIAEKLLEPDFQKYPELVEHSRQVAMLAQRFATALELPPSQVDTIRLAALVHDVGLRLLDYERLYRRASLTAEEMRALAEHPIIGAALVEPLFGAEIAQAVLRHHERVDGRGYPSRISGTQIPLPSRIIQICDAWVAMTSRNTYQAPASTEEAARKLKEGAGTQFDEILTGRFLAALGAIVG
jgi:HD-GYP domain-containing protein (c-di-GMP phosphodiesterase class II)